nr:hypothetical protein [Tanacetum cinerariifolium]
GTPVSVLEPRPCSLNISSYMSIDVAQGHGGDGGGDDRPPSHQVPTGCEGCCGNQGMGTRKPNLGGRKVGRLHTRLKTRNLRLKKITDVHGPVPIRFEWNDREAMMPLGDHTAHGLTTSGSSLGSCRCTTLLGARVLPGQGMDVLSTPPPLPRCTHPSDVQKLKKSNKLLTKQVSKIMRLFRSDDKMSQMLTQLESQSEFGSGSMSGGCKDDESGDGEDSDEDEDDVDS